MYITIKCVTLDRPFFTKHHSWEYPKLDASQELEECVKGGIFTYILTVLSTSNIQSKTKSKRHFQIEEFISQNIN